MSTQWTFENFPGFSRRFTSEHNVAATCRVRPLWSLWKNRRHAEVAGIGRRAALKMQCPKGREGSSPFFGTMRELEFL
jgi:hypothetical protein